MLDTIKASEQPDKKFGLITDNRPISLFQPESPAKLTTKSGNNMISVKKHNNGSRPGGGLQFSAPLSRCLLQVVVTYGIGLRTEHQIARPFNIIAEWEQLSIH